MATRPTRKTLSEVVHLLRQEWEQIELAIAYEAPELAAWSDWAGVIARSADAVLCEAGWSRTGVLDALDGRVSPRWLRQSGIGPMLQTATS